MKFNKEKTNYLLLFIFTLLLFLADTINPFAKQLPTHDSSMFLYFGHGMNNGLTFYSDIFDHKGPILFIFNAIGMFFSPKTTIPTSSEFFNFNFIGVWVLELIVVYISLILIYKTGKLIASSKTTMIAILTLFPAFVFFLQKGNYSEVYAILFISWSLFYVVKFFYDNENFKNYHWIFIGIAGTCTLLLRFNMIILWVVFLLVIEFYYVKDKEFSKALQTFLWTTLGVLLVIVPIAIYSIANGSFSDMIYQSFTFNLNYAGTADLSGMINTIGTFAFFSLFSLLPFFAVLYLYTFFKVKTKNKFEVFFLAYFFLNLVTTIMSGRPYLHYLLTQIPAFVIMIIFSLNYLNDNLLKDKQKKVLSFLFTSVMVVSCLVVLIIRIIPVNTSYAPEDIDKLDMSTRIKKLTNPNDEIYAHNVDGTIYLYSDRFSSTKYFSLPAMDIDTLPSLKNDFLTDIKKSEPKVIVIRNELLKSSNKNQTNSLFIEWVISAYSPTYKNETFTLFTK